MNTLVVVLLVILVVATLVLIMKTAELNATTSNLATAVSALATSVQAAADAINAARAASTPDADVDAAITAVNGVSAQLGTLKGQLDAAVTPPTA